MNEKLIKIAKEALVEHCVSHVRLEKFAELIIQECAEVIMGNEIDHPITGAVYDGDQAKAIKEHFGVKE